ncbi:zinc finger CCCH domain-containing protein 13 [Phyllopteryx taeniolatus]|uniref:zinc finger CCCH domain-containing protein 13 n=1 Tax=Phyllopteryx taeniolatus TaxID=161469 RepID=UPI002AD2225A|nr:zinc finger CCCH domain-containing protein 13 [Phyllopteryx taeniolatus]XP_061653091.1 zinc finger CCCH domain-containing protein 13 [Phyllopteryx taeniolatus]
MMSSKEEETIRFFQYVEENGLKAYNGLLAQNLDHARNEKNRIYLQEKNDKKRKQEEAIRRTGEDIATEGKHLRMGSITMPDPQERMPMPHPHALACGQSFSVRSQSLHSVGGNSGGGDEEVGSPTSRKQPPPKPRRDPATKLSMSSEAVDHSPVSACRGDRCDAQGCSEECRRVPPPKPKRNPNTQLSVSFDESYIKIHGGGGVCPPKGLHRTCSPCERNASPLQSDESPTDDCEDEPVYIEMGGIDVGARELSKSEDEEPGESVYEEMKYPMLDDMEYRTDPVGCRSACPTPAPYDPEPLSRCSTPRNIPFCDIPAPFPNLLTHRPPLLVFPPAPAQCSPNSDESPLTPLDVTKLPMLENQSYTKSPTSSAEPPSSAHIRRELTATPTLTVSGRSSAPPLPCTLYKSSTSSSYQRSHSACPSPVSMGRCLTPLSLMRTPPFDAPVPFPGGLPRSASATPHGKGSPPQDGVGRLHGSMQNVSTGRSRTPTSPLDELTNLFTTGRNMLKKNTSGRKSKEPGEPELKSKSHSDSKREGKERHNHSKDSKRDPKERHSKESSHRRDRDKDRDREKDRDKERDRSSNVESLSHKHNSKERSGMDAPPVRRDSRDSREQGYSSVEPIPVRWDSKDRSGSSVEPIPLIRRDSKDRGISNGDLMPRRDSKDRGAGHGMESLLKQESKDRERLLDQAPELLPRQDSKESARNGVDCRHESRERLLDQPPELLPRQDSRERVRNGVDSKHESRDKPPELLARQESKDRFRTGSEYRHDSKDYRPDLLPRQDSKEKARNEMEHRHEGRIDQPPEILPRQETSKSSNTKDRVSESKHDSRDRNIQNGADLPPPLQPRQDSKDLSRSGLEVRRDSKDRSLNGSDQHQYDSKITKSPTSKEYRYDSKERGYRADGTPRRENRANHSMEPSKAQERNSSTVSGQHSSTTTPIHKSRSTGSPPMTVGTGNDMKAAPKYARSPSMSANPSPMGTPQRRAAETHQSQMPQMPWICGDTTMLEQIERKRTLCKEIRSRQHPHLQRYQERPPPDRSEDRHHERSQCKQESASVLPACGKSSGTKKIHPPPYPTQTTVFWDTAI